MNKKPPYHHDIYDNWELFKPILLGISITFVPFMIFEVHNPYIERKLAFQKACEDKGGFIYSKQNEEEKCIKKDYIVIDVPK